MEPKRGTKAYKEEYVNVYWGINPRSKLVERAYRRRDGVLAKMNPDGVTVLHPVKPGWTAEAEIGLVFGLRQVFGVPIAREDHESVKRRVAELKAQAAVYETPKQDE
jgi:hypothetical protein